MTIIYWDTSALVRRWLGKARQRDRVNRLLAAQGEALAHVSSTLLVLEVLGAVSTCLSSHPKRRTHVQAIERELGAFRLYPIDERVPSARLLIRRHPMGGADGLHLATALFIQRHEQRMDLFVCSDKILKAMAERRFPVWDPVEADPPLGQLKLA